MTVYVYRNGELVEKTRAIRADGAYVSRFEAYESPIDGARISSDRQRERDLARSDSFDTRDLPKDHQWKRGREVQKREANAGSTGRQLDFWR